MKLSLKPLMLAVAGLAMLPSAALAHPKLVTASPAADATAPSTRTIKLTFSERLMPKLSTASLVMTGMPGMGDHPDMKMNGVKSAVAQDGKSIVLTSAKPLPAGSYRADWVIVGADTHRITGKHSFSIR